MFSQPSRWRDPQPRFSFIGGDHGALAWDPTDHALDPLRRRDLRRGQHHGPVAVRLVGAAAAALIPSARA